MEAILFIFLALGAIFSMVILMIMVSIVVNLILFPFRFIKNLFTPRVSHREVKYIPPSAPARNYSPPPPDKYASNWTSISKKHKEKANWTCQKCRVYLGRKEHKRLMQVHHINRDSLDNREANLIALCLICHSEQPGKGHKRLRGAIIKDGRWNLINSIRKS
jgi:hypothetical protein